VLFIGGEDRIDHTPKDENGDGAHRQCGLTIVAEPETDGLQTHRRAHVEMEFEITLRNHKDAPVVWK